MSALAVHTHELSKRYRIGRRAPYSELTDALAEKFRHPFRGRQSRHSTAQDRFIWALKDVNLEVEEGQVFGIIGRNGAGKTTLLKILSEITEPTAGYADVRGRVASFLEVGTGFHPELTGRENIYLSGAILGMRKREIDRKFEEIVDFAEIPQFLDTPVKFYSSGMYVRLGFAVTAFLDSDIIFLDEVLAVGDYRFQQKCLQTMRRAGETGETVMFISHNLAAIRAYCTSCAWIDGGKLRLVSTAEDCVRAYLDAVSEASSDLDVPLEHADRRPGEGEALRFTRLRLYPDHDDGKLRIGEPLRLQFEFLVARPIDDAAIGFTVSSNDGTPVFQCVSSDSGQPYLSLMPGRYSVEAKVPDNVLAFGKYIVAVGARKATETLDWLREPLEFEVIDDARAASWLEPSPLGLIRLSSQFGPLRAIDSDASFGSDAEPTDHNPITRP